MCGKIVYAKPYHRKNTQNICCSRECAAKLKEEKFCGQNNHQYGLKGDKNASWKSDEKISSYGYRLIRCLDHPYANCDGFVFEHRLVAERFLLTDENSTEISGIRYLSPDYVVHHKDHDRLNNCVSNLIVMTKTEHQKLHMEEKRREKSGQVHYSIRKTLR